MATAQAPESFAIGGDLSARSFRTAEKVFSVVVAGAIGVNAWLEFDLRFGVIAAAVALPMWIRTLPRYRFALPLTAVIITAAASGAVLSAFNGAFHTSIPSATLSRTMLLLGLIVCMGALLWARTVVGIRVTSVAFGAGMVAGIPLASTDTGNPWRFTYSIPLTVLILAIAWLLRRRWIEIASLVALAIVGILNDSRSNSAILLLAAIVITWQWVSRAMFGRHRRTPVTLIGLALTGLAVFYVVQGAILDGYFGEATLERTQAQIDRSGSVLLGGRPEMAASAAIIARYPLGLGSGIKATLGDVVAAKSSMSSIGYNPNNGYVERFMFGSGIEVHSFTGDAWIWFGIPGLVLAAFLLFLVAYGLQDSLRSSALSALFAYLSFRFVWDLLFSPFFTTLNLVPLALAIALLLKPGHEPEPGSERFATRVGDRS